IRGWFVGRLSRPGYGLSNGLSYGLRTGLAVWFGVILVSWLGVVTGVGLGSGLFSWLDARIDLGPLDQLMSGLGIGLIYTMSTAFIAGLSGEEVATKTMPNEGIHRSARIALLSGVGSGLMSGLLIGLGSGISNGLARGLRAGLAAGLFWGLIVGLITGITIGMRYGGRACLQHLLLRLALRYNGSAPWRYAAFLDYAAERIFLRKLGGGYVFIHRMLLEYFAALHQP